MTRQVNGEGNLSKTANGKWRIMIMVGYGTNGKPIKKSKVCATQAECIKWRDEQKRLKKQKRVVTKSTITVSQLLQDYIASRKSLKPKSIEDYQDRARLINAHISCRAQKLTLLRVQDMVDSMTDRAPTTVRLVVSFISNACDWGIAIGVLEHNPTKGVQLPVTRHKEQAFWDKSQLQVFSTAIIGHRYEAMFRLSLMGLRRGEVCGLQVEDVDIANKQITIQHNCVLVGNKVMMLDEPKTSASIRTLPISDGLTDMLTDWIGNRTTGNVFHSIRTPYMSPQGYYNAYRQVVADTDLPLIRLHDLRGSACSLMLSEGIPVKTVSKYLGHSKIQTTLDIYARVTINDKLTATELLDKLLPA
jgi:integrase